MNETGDYIVAQVVQSYSGRKDLVFNLDELEEFMSNRKDGDRVMLEAFGDDYKESANERYKEILPIAEHATGMKLTNTREAGNALIRSIVAYRLVKEGYHYSEIGKAMGRNHSTVSHYVKKVENMLSVPRAYRREMGLLNEFVRLLEE